jgi:3-hydroxybutyryl-CoA dehydrogenase
LVGPLDRQHAVEVVSVTDTSPEMMKRAAAFFAALGKQPVDVGHIPALYLPRTIAAIIREARFALAEGVAAEGDIDLAMRLGTRYPAGPFAWEREVGRRRISLLLDVLAAVDDSAANQSGTA